MRQSNGYSTSAPRSSAAKQWFEQLAQKKTKTKGIVKLVYNEMKKIWSVASVHFQPAADLSNSLHFILHLNIDGGIYCRDIFNVYCFNSCFITNIFLDQTQAFCTVL